MWTTQRSGSTFVLPNETGADIQDGLVSNDDLNVVLVAREERASFADCRSGFVEAGWFRLSTECGVAALVFT